MTTIEKKMVAGVIFFIVILTLSVMQLSKALEPVVADVDKNGIKPYVMRIWEGKK